MSVILMFAPNGLSSDINKSFQDAFQDGHLKEINFLSFKASKLMGSYLLLYPPKHSF